jgi:hypothetical protein
MENSSDSLLSRWKWPLAAGGLLLLAMGWFGYRWLNPAYAPPVQPVPNAYNALVGLGGQLSSRTGFYDEVPEQELATIVSANAQVLDKAREALRKDSVVALEWTADEQWFSNVHLKNIEHVKSLSRALAAEGLLAVKQGDSQLAVHSGLENLYLAKAVANGGLGTDWLTGAATYTAGLTTLRNACEIATSEDCKTVLGKLPDARNQLELPATITEREWHFWRRINGPYQTFLTELTFSNNRADFEKRMEGITQAIDARTELLRLHYAIRAFQLTENRLPKSLDELAGRELKAIPKDSYSGRDFIYQPGKDRYILYSVGPNGIDDGGFVNDKDGNAGDLVLEPYTPDDDDALQD